MKVLSIIKSVMPKNFEQYLNEPTIKFGIPTRVWNLEEYHRKLKWWRNNGSFNEELYHRIVHLKNNLDIK